MRKTISPEVKKRCRVWVKVEYREKGMKPLMQWLKFHNYKAINRRVGNTFLDRTWGPFVYRSITLLPYGPELPV